MRLSIFSCTYWPFICHLEKCLIPFLIYKCIICLFVRSTLYILNTNSLWEKWFAMLTILDLGCRWDRSELWTMRIHWCLCSPTIPPFHSHHTLPLVFARVPFGRVQHYHSWTKRKKATILPRYAGKSVCSQWSNVFVVHLQLKSSEGPV